MVYYGAASKGCECCRKRKVKCDEQRPQCFKCIKLGIICPGYRDLQDVLFRDESSRIIRNATRCVPNVASGQPATIDVPDPISTASSTTSGFTHNLSLSISPSQPLEEIGANFFFTKYGFELPPTFAGHTTWLSQTYFSGHHVLRPTIEAVGMAGLSNIRDEPSIMSLAKRRSQEAVIATKKALNDPVEGLADETFMAVILLAFFEFISFEDWTRYGYWLEHIKAATALLELRGPKQFTRVRGAQLLVQVRSPILAACLQQRLVAPPAIVQATWQFETAPIRDSLKSRYIASPASISEISLRLVNLRAAAKNLHKDIESVRRAALVIDNDLKAWREVVSPAWLYQTVESSTADDTFGGKKQVYNIPWVAEVWNNWRALRIAVYQVVLLGENIHTPGMDKVNDAAVEVIRQMSEEICISVSAFTENRKISLVRPLYLVATEQRNSVEVRRFAVNQLRRIGIEMGARQAVMLADTIGRILHDSIASDGRDCVAIDCESIPLAAPY